MNTFKTPTNQRHGWKDIEMLGGYSRVPVHRRTTMRIAHLPWVKIHELKYQSHFGKTYKYKTLEIYCTDYSQFGRSPFAHSSVAHANKFPGINWLDISDQQVISPCGVVLIDWVPATFSKSIDNTKHTHIHIVFSRSSHSTTFPPNVVRFNSIACQPDRMSSGDNCVSRNDYKFFSLWNVVLLLTVIFFTKSKLFTFFHVWIVRFVQFSQVYKTWSFESRFIGCFNKSAQQ